MQFLWGGFRPDSHAPIGVISDHAHEAGEVMFSYRYMFMNMNQNYVDMKRVSTDDIIAPKGQFAISPEKMTIHMHRFGIMFAPIDRITIMTMLPLIHSSMSHRIAVSLTSNPMVSTDSFETNSLGIGDLKFALLVPIPFFSEDVSSIVVALGVTLPTGSIDQKDEIPIPLPRQERILAYPMQVGSGTIDLLPALTYLFMADSFSIGLQGKGSIRLDQNKQGYKLGNRVLATVWLSHVFAIWVSGSFRVEWQSWSNLEGADSRIAQYLSIEPPKSVPTAQPDLQGGHRLGLYLGFNLYTEKGPGLNQRLAFEFGYSLYQKLNGPQLGNQFIITVGWQLLAFDFYQIKDSS